ncbi:hypothetical protein FRC07_010866, partial [Ceratobasidium sp. 392]
HTSLSNEDSTSKELEQLFGTCGEETVQYKPNPWSIAKINANARATSKPSSKPSKPREKIIPGFTRPHRKTNHAFFSNSSGSKPPKDSRTWLPQPKAPPNRSLRDSISAALRRNSTSASAPIAPLDTRETAIIPDPGPPNNSRFDGVEASPISPQDTYSEANDGPSSALVPHPLDSAYIPQNDTIIPQISDNDLDQGQITAAYSSDPDPDTYEGQTPALTFGDPNSDGLVSPIMDDYTSTGFPSASSSHEEQRFLYEGTLLLSPAIDQPSPNLRPEQAISEGLYLEGRFESIRDSGLGYVLAKSPIVLHPPPTFQLTTEPSPEAQVVGESQDRGSRNRYTNYREESPIFAYEAPSPVSEKCWPNTSYTSTPARKRKRAPEPVDFNDGEEIAPAIRREPITPVQPTRRHATSWLDPDEEPVWSTLPARGKKSQAKTSPVTTARFRLPGAFLGSSSPLEGQDSKRLYKPPPRKRSLEQDETDIVKWKVTRIG